MNLDMEKALTALGATGTLDGLSIEGNSYKITQLLALREHLLNAVQDVQSYDVGSLPGPSDLSLAELVRAWGFSSISEVSALVGGDLSHRSLNNWHNGKRQRHDLLVMVLIGARIKKRGGVT